MIYKNGAPYQGKGKRIFEKDVVFWTEMKLPIFCFNLPQPTQQTPPSPAPCRYAPPVSYHHTSGLWSRSANQQSTLRGSVQGVDPGSLPRPDLLWTGSSVYGSDLLTMFFPHVQEFAVSTHVRNTPFLSTLTRGSITTVCRSELTLPQ